MDIAYKKGSSWFVYIILYTKNFVNCCTYQQLRLNYTVGIIKLKPSENNKFNLVRIPAI